MFYTNKVLFIHVPRTGGSWLTDWAAAYLEASVDRHHLKHASMETIHQLIPQTRKLEVFCINRSRDERLQSYYKLTSGPVKAWTEGWNRLTKAIREMTYEEFLASPYVPMDTPQNVHLQFPYEKPHQNVLEWLKVIHGSALDVEYKRPIRVRAK